MPSQIACQREDRQIERERVIVCEMQRQNIAPILGHLLFERTWQRGFDGGYFVTSLDRVRSVACDIAAALGFGGGVEGFEEARAAVFAQHQERTHIGPVVIGDQILGIPKLLVFGFERVVLRLERSGDIIVLRVVELYADFLDALRNLQHARGGFSAGTFTAWPVGMQLLRILIADVGRK